MESNRRWPLARSPLCAQNGTVQHVKRRSFLTILLSTLCTRSRARVLLVLQRLHRAVSRTNACRLAER